MAEKLVKVQNVSRADFHLSLDFVKEGKFYDMKPNAIVSLDVDEMNYLTTQCAGCFEKGFLHVVEASGDKDIELPNEDNIMSNEDIEKLINKNLTQFKKDIAKITSQHLIKDIRQACIEANKTDKFVQACDARFSELADGSISM